MMICNVPSCQRGWGQARSVGFAWMAWVFSTLWCTAAELPTDQVEFFEKRIRPALVKYCYECHSAATEASGGLLLDSKVGASKGGESGPAIVPGNANASRLIQAIEYKNLSLQMPPDGRLPQDVMASFRKWVETGAADPRTAPTENQAAKPKQTGLPVADATKHWAYRTVVDHAIPPLTIPNSTAIDCFVDEKIRQTGLFRAPESEKLALLRRLTFDLHGLPPTPAEVEQFTGDTSQDAYDRLVDRLLASPRFGERMARHWMDVVRYGESVTLRGFVFKDAWRYRDYLIESFGRDRPFNTVLKEQVAGDLMHEEDRHERSLQITAATFLTLGNTNFEEQDKKQLEMDFVDEQLDVIGRVYMGQTIGCARCHDHKFDPIPVRDYYAMAGILKGSRAFDHANLSKWLLKPLPVADELQQQYARLDTELAELNTRAAELKKLLGATTSKDPKQIPIEQLEGVVIDDTQAKKIGYWSESSASKPYVGVGYIHDGHADQGTKTVTFEPKSLPPGTYQVRISYAPGSNRASNASVKVFSADGEREILIDQSVAPPDDGAWFPLGSYRFEPNGQAFVIVSNANADGHVIADAVQFLSTEVAAPAKLPVTLAKSSNTTATPNPADTAKSAETPTESAEIKQRKKEVAKLDRHIKDIEAQLAMRPVAMGIEEQLPAKDIAIHVRGSVHTLGEVVPRGFLQAVSTAKPVELSASTSGRLEMADWLSSDRNPLTTRVLVNRVWYWMMGEGLVDTVDNFGTTGQSPSHPELLDWLSTRFQEGQWSVKKLVRQLVLSDVYRRSVIEPNQVAITTDPANRLYWRGNARRVDAESLRDAMLAISGELQYIPGGPTFRADVKDDYAYQHQPALRSVFQPVFRNSLPELLEAFDFPNPSMSAGRRSRSTVAPQALLLMNNAWVEARAKNAANRIVQETGVTDERHWIEAAYALCYGREPSTSERVRCEQFLNSASQLDQSSAARFLALEQLIQSLFASIDFRFLE